MPTAMSGSNFGCRAPGVSEAEFVVRTGLGFLAFGIPMSCWEAFQTRCFSLPGWRPMMANGMYKVTPCQCCQVPNGRNFGQAPDFGLLGSQAGSEKVTFFGVVSTRIFVRMALARCYPSAKRLQPLASKSSKEF